MSFHDEYEKHAANVNSTNIQDLNNALAYFTQIKNSLPANSTNKFVIQDHIYYQNLINDLQGKING